MVSINGQKHWLWRAVDQNGYVLDALVQSRRNAKAAQRPMRKLIREQGCVPRVMVADKLPSYGAARRKLNLTFEHRQHKGPNNRAENSHQPTRRRDKIMRHFKSARHLQRFVSIHDPIANLFHLPRIGGRYTGDARADDGHGRDVSNVDTGLLLPQRAG